MKRDQSGRTRDHQLVIAWAEAVGAVVGDGDDVDPPEAGAAVAGAVVDGDLVGDDRRRLVVELEPPAPDPEAADPPSVAPDAVDPRSFADPLPEPVVPVVSRPVEPFRCLPDVEEWVAGWVVEGLDEGDPPHAARPRTTRTVTPAPQIRLTGTVSLSGGNLGHREGVGQGGPGHARSP